MSHATLIHDHRFTFNGRTFRIQIEKDRGRWVSRGTTWSGEDVFWECLELWQFTADEMLDRAENHCVAAAMGLV